MKATPRRPVMRRTPQQRRARQTVEAVLDAVTRILKRDGVEAVTTNRVAAVAGVSIGSVYQYFPDKRAIFRALHDRHADAIGQLVDRTLVEHAASPTSDVLRALVEAMIEAHEVDPVVHELLSLEAPHRAEGARAFETRLAGAVRLALASSQAEGRDLYRHVFVLTHMIEALAHGAVLRRPPRLTLAAAKDEAVRAVLTYFRSIGT